MKLTTNHKEEVELLKKESELPLEDLLKELPSDYLEDWDKFESPLNETDEAVANVRKYKYILYKYPFLHVKVWNSFDLLSSITLCCDCFLALITYSFV